MLKPFHFQVLFFLLDPFCPYSMKGTLCLSYREQGMQIWSSKLLLSLTVLLTRDLTRFFPTFDTLYQVVRNLNNSCLLQIAIFHQRKLPSAKTHGGVCICFFVKSLWFDISVYKFFMYLFMYLQQTEIITISENHQSLHNKKRCTNMDNSCVKQDSKAFIWFIQL